MKFIIFNFATRSRPDKANAVLKNIASMCDPAHYRVVMKIDRDDPTCMDIENVPGTQLEIGWNVSTSKIHAINRDIPKMPWDILVDISDDFIFTKQGFDKIIRDHCGPDDCLHFPEPFATSQSEKAKNENIIIMACMGRKYYDRFGYIYNPEYKSLFCDNELTAVAKKLGRYKFVDESIFYHAHPAAGYGKADAQTQRTESFWKEDKATYYRRKEAGFP